jgi:prophage antirepressor-like protein
MLHSQEKQATGLQNFAFEAESEIRVVPNAGNPLFCLADVCHALGINNPSYVKERLNPKGIVLNYTLTKGGKQHLLFINEGNLYKVIFRSDKPNARKFEDWVTDEVLPAIRKTGSYTATSAPQLAPTLEAEYAQLRIAYRHERGQREYYQRRCDYYMDRYSSFLSGLKAGIERVTEAVRS